MGNPTRCLAVFRKAANAADKAAVEKRIRALTKTGLKQREAAAQAVDEQIAAVQALMMKAVARPAVPPKPETAPAAPASQPKAPAPQATKHPRTIMGSRLLALVSEKLNGLDPAILADVSERFETKKKGKDGKNRIEWRNPLVTGIGTFFRRGGAQDFQQIAELLEANGYLEPGSVERDAKEAGEQAIAKVRAALNKAEPMTVAEREAEAQSSQDAEADAHYAELDAESARELEAERQAVMAESAIEPEGMDALTDDDIAFDFTPQEASNASRDQDQSSAAPGNAGEAGQDASQGQDAPAETRSAAPGAAEEGLTLAAQDSADLQAKADREAAAAQAEAAEQRALAARDAAPKRAAEKAEKDRRAAEILAEREAAKKAEVDAAAETFQLGDEPPKPVDRKVNTAQAAGQGDVFAQPEINETSAEAVAAPVAAQVRALSPEAMEKAREVMRLTRKYAPKRLYGPESPVLDFIERGWNGVREQLMLEAKRKELADALGVEVEAYRTPGSMAKYYRIVSAPNAVRTMTLGEIESAQPDQAIARPERPAETQRAPVDVITMPEATIASLAGKTVSIDVQVGDTGQMATLKMDAAEAVRNVKKRFSAAEILVRCLQ